MTEGLSQEPQGAVVVRQVEGAAAQVQVAHPVEARQQVGQRFGAAPLANLGQLEAVHLVGQALRQRAEFALFVHADLEEAHLPAPSHTAVRNNQIQNASISETEPSAKKKFQQKEKTRKPQSAFRKKKQSKAQQTMEEFSQAINQ